MKLPDWFAALPGDAAAFATMGTRFAEASDFQNAAFAFARAAQLGPAKPEYHAALGAMLQRLGELDEAWHAYERAAWMDTKNIQVWTNLGETHLQRGAYEQALEALKRAVALDPQGTHSAGARARALILKTAKG